MRPMWGAIVLWVELVSASATDGGSSCTNIILCRLLTEFLLTLGSGASLTTSQSLQDPSRTWSKENSQQHTRTCGWKRNGAPSTTLPRVSRRQTKNARRKPSSDGLHWSRNPQ